MVVAARAQERDVVVEVGVLFGHAKHQPPQIRLGERRLEAPVGA